MTPPLPERLSNIVDAAWAALAEAGELPVVVEGSIPIAWFGDLEGYLQSPVRVITVGLNPSLAEFPEADRLERFPAARLLDGAPRDDAARAVYVRSLNRYFLEAPYTSWFKPSFDELLNGMDCSYWPDRSGVALHTDLCSPVATDPTWSRLRSERAVLASTGVLLWHDLVQFLEPDVVVTSVARGYLDQISFEWTGPWRAMHTVDGPTRTRPYVAEARECQVTRGQQATVVFGQAANKPFGTVSTLDKRAIGAAILEARRAS